MLGEKEKQRVIDRVRGKRKKLADVLEDEEYSGIRKIVEELYPDSAHFIFELLQNAEDTEATEVCFKLEKDCLTFEHNGRPFTEEDILAITNIGKGTKSNNSDMIGRFGVGFKAVFAYTETPRIWSTTFSFEIRQLVLPYSLNDRTDLNSKTRFKFPFNNPEKPARKAFSEVQDGLRSLAETTLLFLTHIKCISWKVSGDDLGVVRRQSHPGHHIEVISESNGEPTKSSHFLRFTQPVEGLEGQASPQVAIAFALEMLPKIEAFDPQVALKKQLKIMPVKGKVAVFFPAEKETSSLRFHLHAPFVPELSRASIKETPANEPLIKQLADLTADSLHHIRDYGLLTLDFLAVLPNIQDSLPDRYEAIQRAIIDAMNNENLTPTHNKSHAPANRLLQAKASLKNLLSESDLEYLVNYVDAPVWAVGATQRNSNVDRLLDSLAIREWGLEDFVGYLYEQMEPEWEDPDEEEDSDYENYIKWLSSKSIEWHQQFYALLYSELDGEEGIDEFELKELKIVKLRSGGYSTGIGCYFPDESDSDDNYFPRVDSRVYTSGNSKKQQENARKYLEEIGVSEVGEAELVSLNLALRYTGKHDFPTKEIYQNDINRFMELRKNDLHSAYSFRDYYIFLSEEGWCKPTQVYLDTPFGKETGLRAWYRAKDDEADKFALDKSYYQEIEIPLKSIAEFAKTLGATNNLEVSECSCDQNPQWDHLSGGGGSRYTYTGKNRDYEITGLTELLEKPTEPLSKLVWHTMETLSECYLQAQFRWNSSYTSRYAHSSLVHDLRSAAWIPQKKISKTSFVRPAEASADALPAGFPFDQHQPWLKAVGWGEAARIESERQIKERIEKENAAKLFGIPDPVILTKIAKIAKNLSPEELMHYLDELERTAGRELPDHSPKDPDRRGPKVGSDAADAPSRDTETKHRSVPVGLGQIKEDAGQYLEEQYILEDELFCQICKSPMPFKLDDGSSYFEKVEFLSSLTNRHHRNYLALCPNHAAMFKHANSTKEFMREKFLELTGNELEVVLARKHTTIYFTKTHIFDLKKIIEVDGSINGSD